MFIETTISAGRTISLVGLLVCGLTSVQAQTVYRSVGPDGRVTFSDRPPASASQATPLSAGTTEGAAAASLPFALRQIVAKYPVTLYSSMDCAPCDEGRNLLRARGVPFSEKTVNTPEDAKAYQNLANGNSVPMLTIGAQQLKGFTAAEWQQYLGIAGYPASSQLPANYRNPAPQPLVLLQAAPSPSSATSAPEPTQPVPPPPGPTPTNPAGIQF